MLINNLFIMPADYKIPVTVIVPVKNEERNLSCCLTLLDDFSEVIVVDSNSVDNTPQIVEQYGFKLVNFNWDGKFPKKRNWTLRNIGIQNEWVLFLDADELVTDEFKKEIIIKIKNNEYSGFWIYYSNHFLGKNLKHGLKIKKMALFNRNKGEYEFIDEKWWSSFDMEIHEHPIIEGRIGYISAPLIHLDFKSLSHYNSKHNEYSSWEANRYIELTKSKDIKLTYRQKIKYLLLNTGLLGYLYFILNYFILLGFLDGKAGYIYSVFKMNYFFQIKAKIYELRKSQVI